MICPYCKAGLPEGTQYCSNCGQHVYQTNNQSSASLSYWNTVEKEIARDEKIRADVEGEILQKQKQRQGNVGTFMFFVGFVGLLILYFVSVYPIQQHKQYETAVELLNSGEYSEAMVIFESMEEYEDSAERILECQEGIKELRYQDGLAQYQSGNYEAAKTIFEELSSYKDCHSLSIKCLERLREQRYEDGMVLYQSGNYQEAYVIFEELGYYKDCKELARECQGHFSEVENNNTYEKANSIFLNKEYAGTLQSSYETEQDWYVFTLEKDCSIFLVFISEEQSKNDSYWDVSIRSFYDPDGNLWRKHINGNITKTESETLYLQAGTYYVEIESSNMHSSDPYSIKVVCEEDILDEESKSTITDTVDIDSPFANDYWIVFTEGSRYDRVEASSVNSQISSDSLYIIWEGALYLNDSTGASECVQYYLDENSEWIEQGTWSTLSDYASNIIASNLDVYDTEGNLLVEGCAYSEVDWTLIDKFQ